MKKFIAYLEAGLDESLAKFMKGLLASVLVAAGEYSYHHLSGSGLSVIQVASAFGFGTPALIAFWHYLKTTADSQDVKESDSGTLV